MGDGRCRSREVLYFPLSENREILAGLTPTTVAILAEVTVEALQNADGLPDIGRIGDRAGGRRERQHRAELRGRSTRRPSRGIPARVRRWRRHRVDGVDTVLALSGPACARQNVASASIGCRNSPAGVLLCGHVGMPLPRTSLCPFTTATTSRPPTTRRWPASRSAFRGRSGFDDDQPALRPKRALIAALPTRRSWGTASLTTCSSSCHSHVGSADHSRSFDAEREPRRLARHDGSARLPARQPVGDRTESRDLNRHRLEN